MAEMNRHDAKFYLDYVRRVKSIQIMSDLHLETPEILPKYDSFQITAHSPYLALLGDIGHVHDNRLFRFLEQQMRQFEIVFYVLGNHEPYSPNHEMEGCTYDAAVDKLEKFERRMMDSRRQEAESETDLAAPLGTFYFMNRTRVDLEGTNVTVLGCTLFSHISEAQEGTASLLISDFSRIEDWSVRKHNQAHARDLAWLNAQVADVGKNERSRVVVILTHHSPTCEWKANDPEHLADDRGVQSAFATDMSKELCWTSRATRLWAWGHTHYNCDFRDWRGKRLVANQRGYGREDIYDFDADKVVDLGDGEAQRFPSPGSAFRAGESSSRQSYWR